MSQLPETQGLQVTGQGRHHAQQQLRKMLRLDLDVRLLEEFEKLNSEGRNLGFSHRLLTDNKSGW